MFVERFYFAFPYLPTCAWITFPSVFSWETYRILPKFQEFTFPGINKTLPELAQETETLSCYFGTDSVFWNGFKKTDFFFPPNSGTESFLHLNKTQMDNLWMLLKAKKCPHRSLLSWWDVGVIVRKARSSFSYMSRKIQSWVRKLGFSDLTELSFSFKKQVIIHLQTHLSLLCCQ